MINWNRYKTALTENQLMALIRSFKQKFSDIRNYWKDVMGFLKARRALEAKEKRLKKSLDTASDKMDRVFAKKRESLSHVNTNTSIKKLESTLSDFEVFIVNDIQQNVNHAEQLTREIKRTLQKLPDSPHYHDKIVEGSETITEELEEEISRSEMIINSSIEKLDRGAPPEEIADQVREFKVDTQKENVDKVDRNIQKIGKLLKRNSLQSFSGWKNMLSFSRSKKLRKQRQENFSSSKTGDLNADF